MVTCPPAVSLSPTDDRRQRQSTLATKVCNVQRREKSEILVLVASGFEEADVSAVTRALRRSGLAVALVGLAAGPVRGAYGLSLMPDRSFSEVEAQAPRAVALPGGVQGIRQLATDPRVHRLLHQVVDQGGYVVALSAAAAILRTAGVVHLDKPGSVASPGEQTPSLRVWREGQVIWLQDAAAAQEAAQTLASLLGGGA